MSKKYSQTKFWEFATKAIDIIEKEYGPVVIFEHGAQHDSSMTGCGTAHAHMHAVPLDFSLCTEALRYDSALTWRRCGISAVESFAAGSEYLFVADHFNGADTTGIVCLLKEPTSQFFRRVIAARLGLSELYDYKKYQMLEIATASYRKMSRVASTGKQCQVFCR